jgi:NYN domain
MAFVDGENFTIRAQQVAVNKGLTFVEGEYYHRDVFVWFPNVPGRAALFPQPPLKLQPSAIRSHYYASSTGDEPKLASIREALWKLGFHPEVFKRDSGTKRSKGVDIALAKDFLCNAFNDNYDVAVLFAGDGDYVPMVEEVKRMGKVVYVAAFYESGLSPTLRLASDECFGIDKFFFDQWRKAEGITESGACADPGAAPVPVDLG